MGFLFLEPGVGVIRSVVGNFEVYECVLFLCGRKQHGIAYHHFFYRK